MNSLELVRAFRRPNRSIRTGVWGCVVVALLTITGAATPAGEEMTTFGRDTPGSQAFAMGEGYKRSSRFSLPEAGTVTQLVAYLDGLGGVSGSQQIRFAIYADEAGAPAALLAQTDVGAVEAGATRAWVKLPLQQPLALAPGAYHLAVLSGANGRVARYWREPKVDALRSGSDTFTDGAANPYGPSSLDGFELAIHAELVPSAPAPAIPANLAPPLISGTAQVGQTLTTSNGSWSNDPTGYAFSWRRCELSGSDCNTIAGATDPSYTLVPADHAFTIRTVVTAANASGSATATSDPTGAVAARPGTAFGRQDPGSQWLVMREDYKRSSRFTLPEDSTVTELAAYLDGLGGGSGTQQIRFAIYADRDGEPGALLAQTGVGTVAAGATGSWVSLPLENSLTLSSGSYHLAVMSGPTALAGMNGRIARYSREPKANALRAGGDQFTDGAADPYGSSSVDQYELAIHAVSAPATAPPTPVALPVNLAPPSIGGTVAVGETLTASTGLWANSPTAYSYTWRRCDLTGSNCDTISGAAGQSYTLVPGDEGTTIRTTVAAVNAGGTAIATSLPTRAVAAAPLVSCALFASPLGSDGAVGSAVAPLASVQVLLDRLGVGQTGCLFGGSYLGNLSLGRGGVTLASVPGQRARLLGYVWIKNTANDVTLRDLEIDGHDVGPPTVQINGDRVLLRNLEITNRNKPGTSYNAMCVLAGPNFEASAANIALDLRIEQSRIHNCGDDAHEHAIYLESTRNARVVDSHLYDNPGYGIHMYPDSQGSLIEYTLIDGNSSKCKANLTFSGERAGGEYALPHASSNNTVRYSLITNSLCRFNVESYYPQGALTPSGNLLHNNCIWNAPLGNYGYLTTEAGSPAYSQRDNLNTDPHYRDRPNKDYTLQTSSPCTGYGPRP